MKMFKLFLISLCILLGSIKSFAQDNYVKAGIFGLPFGNIALSYERALSYNTSVALNASMLIPRKLPATAVSSMGLVDETKLSGFSITPEYRYYTSKKKKMRSPRGFYISPYLTFNNYKCQFTDFYLDSKVKADINFYILGGGIQIGKHWVIADRISIDWTFIGLGISGYTLKARLTAPNSGINFAELEDDIKMEAYNVPMAGDNLKTKSGADYLEVKLPIVHIGVRSAFTIGIAF